jgi:DNA mismatch repair protein MutL
LGQALLSAFGNDDWHYLAWFSLPADSIDVNVHPNKTIIKFMENSKLISLLTSTVKEMAKPRAATSSSASSTASASAQSFTFGSTENYQLLQERHDYNMDGLFSPHGLDSHKTDEFWCGGYLVKQEKERWLAIHAGKLVELFVKENLHEAASSIPLLVSEPYPSRGISEKTIRELNEKGFEFERLGSDTIVMRAIPEWMNGLPLKELVQCLLTGEKISSLTLRPGDWSSSGWDDMIASIGHAKLFESNVVCDLQDLLREKLR